MKKIKLLLRDWHFARILRLVIGGLFVFNGLAEQLWALPVIGGILIYQAAVNSGCSTSCRQAAFRQKLPSENQPIEFEGIKTNAKSINHE